MFVQPDQMQQTIKTQLDWIAKLPASQEAERLIRLVRTQRLDPTPALLDLLNWAVETGPAMGLDTTAGVTMQSRVMQLALKGRWADAVTGLLNLDDPENEAPKELMGLATPRQVAEAMLSMAR